MFAIKRPRIIVITGAESTGKSESAKAEAKKEKEKEKLQEEQAKLGGIVNPSPFGNRDDVVPISGGQLDQTNDEIAALQLSHAGKKPAPALKDEKQEKERLAEIDREERRLQLLKDKKQRIEAEVKDNDEELKAFD